MHKSNKRLEERWRSNDDGPHSSTELQQWCSQLLSRLDGFQRQQVKSFLRKAVGFSTAYPGCGFFESAVMQLSRYVGVKAPSCLDAWEI